MPNVLSVYDPLFYAQEALILLEKALGLGARVHRGYDATPQQKGSIINIRKPSTFTAQDAPGSDQSIAADYVAITLNKWREVKFALSDKELAFTKEDIIREHIRPAAYALADDVDQYIAAFYKQVPWYFDVAGGPGSTLVLNDLSGVRGILRNNAVPDLNDPAMVHLMIGGAEEGALLPLIAPFTMSGPQGSPTLQRGTIGSIFGMETFVNQNRPTHVPGVAADATGTLTGAHAKGATTVTIGGVTDGGTVKIGDSFVIAGGTQRYVFMEDATATGGNLTSVDIFPKLAQAFSGSEVVTINLDAHAANLAFHRNAFALATAPLSEMGGQLGARIATITSQESALSIRSRVWYVGDSSAVKVGLDLLYGGTVLDPNLAARLRG